MNRVTGKMDLIHKDGAKCTGANVVWDPIVPKVGIPYFGTQARFSDFFAAVIQNYFPDLRGVKYAETNSGNCDSSFLYATEYGMNVITNDLGLYSYYTARAIGGRNTPEKVIEDAAYCAALVDVMDSYTPQLPYTQEQEYQVKSRQQEWINKFKSVRVEGAYVENYNMDLEKFLDFMPEVDVLFSDYAWPWRMAGTGETEEYTASVDLFRKYLTGEEIGFTALTREEIVPFVLRNLPKSLKKCKYFLLSNQSSNYPDPETLEFALTKAGYEYDRYTMFTEKQDVDDLGNQDEYLDNGLWCETVYVIKGEL